MFVHLLVVVVIVCSSDRDTAVHDDALLLPQSKLYDLQTLILSLSVVTTSSDELYKRVCVLIISPKPQYLYLNLLHINIIKILTLEQLELT